uniref:Uncharacterized protein n=1 Tax=Haliotis diversicolor TaxID=36095 RepID=B3TK41_HALDV|nr:unknown protein 6 [Haliotis diversicolor]
MTLNPHNKWPYSQLHNRSNGTACFNRQQIHGYYQRHFQNLIDSCWFTWMKQSALCVYVRTCVVCCITTLIACKKDNAVIDVMSIDVGEWDTMTGINQASESSQMKRQAKAAEHWVQNWVRWSSLMVKAFARCAEDPGSIPQMHA